MFHRYIQPFIDKIPPSTFVTLQIVFGCAIILGTVSLMDIRNGAPPYGIDEEEIPPSMSDDPYAYWKRPTGPAKVALQVGHWKNDEFPHELAALRGNTGASAGGIDEWQVNLAIAQQTAKLLHEKGVIVEILPATVPPMYWADAFIAIHTDGSTNPSVSGFKVAAPWRDLTDKADILVSQLKTHYQLGTQLVEDPNITRNMRGYYAFAWWRFEHTIHPMTTAAILETGFLTNPYDRQLLTEKTEIPALALANGILEYLQVQNLI